VFERRTAGSPATIGLVSGIGTGPENGNFEVCAIHKRGTDYHGWLCSCDGTWQHISHSTFAPAVGAIGFVMRNTSANALGPSIFGIDYVYGFETDTFPY
jgi:hypothetical protein